MLLMVQAYQTGDCPAEQTRPPKEAFWEGHLLESETYVGGHVESIEAGVFRADIPVNFAVDTTAIDELLQDLDAAFEVQYHSGGKEVTRRTSQTTMKSNNRSQTGCRA